MADIKVKQVQEWLLKTYGKRSEFEAFVDDYNFRANGETGNATMTVLVMALQYESGISEPSDSFGPTTMCLSNMRSVKRCESGYDSEVNYGNLTQTLGITVIVIGTAFLLYYAFLFVSATAVVVDGVSIVIDLVAHIVAGRINQSVSPFNYVIQ